MSEWRLLQLDFYNILAPAVTKVPEKDPDAENRPRIEPGDDEYLDLKIRALMHGFDEEVDPNDVAHLLEEEPIPLRSMRIPIRRNVSAGWAPNGYGKTYIFDYLERQTKHMNGIVEVPRDLQEAQRMNDDPIVIAAREIAEQYNTNEYLLHNKRGFFSEEHWDLLFGSHKKHLDTNSINSALSNPPAGTVSIASSLEELKFELARKFGDGTLSGRTKDGGPILYPGIERLKKFATSSHWEQEDERLNVEHPNSKMVPYHCRGCLVENTTTGEVFGILEFPNVSVWDIHMQQNTPAVFFREIPLETGQEEAILTDWSYSRTRNWKEVEDQESQEFDGYAIGPVLTSNLSLGGHETIGSLMDSFDVEYVEIPKLASKDRFSEFLAAQSSRLTTPYEFNSSRYQTLASNSEPLAPISQPEGLVREAGLLRVIEEIRDEISLICDPNFIGNDGFGFEKRVSTIHALIGELNDTRDEWHLLGEALFDDDAEVWSREVKEIIGHMFDIRFVVPEQDELRRDIYSKLSAVLFEKPVRSTLSSKVRDYMGLQTPGIDCLRSFEFIFDWMNTMVEHAYSPELAGDVDLMNPHIIAERKLIGNGSTFAYLVGLFARHRRQKLRLSYAEYALDTYEDIEDIEEDVEHLGRLIDRVWDRELTFPLDLVEFDREDEWLVEDIIEMTFKSLNIDFTFEDGVLVYPSQNHFILSKELNRCLSPSNHAHNPWGVEASILFETNEENDTSETASIFFHPVATDRMNTLRPEHLSFGMRSETVLQLKLSEYLSERRDDWHRSPDLLIIDEPEIGRSEYWTTMLIHRLRRFEQQFGSDGQQSVLVVSHRGDVLENCTQSGDYTIMHRTPQSEE